MWKWARLVIVVTILGVILLVPYLPVQADTSQDITITATGYVVEAPGGFTVTYISDYEVGLSWTKGVDAENTMVRACIGRVPENREDGYEVYYGTETSTTDWVNMETLSVPIYYKAWSQNAGGIWEEQGSDPGQVEGVSMTLIAFIVLAMGLTIATFALKSGRGILAFASAGAWVLLGVYSYTRYDTLWDIYYALFWLSMGMTIACALIPAILREKKEIEPTIDDFEEDRDLMADIETGEKDRARMDRLFGPRRHRPRKLSRFARTGKE